MAKREYDNDYPSVTQILSVLRKPGLEQWFLNNTRRFCNEESRKGKEVGTQIHSVIQSYIETGEAKIDTEYQTEVTNALKSFAKFRKDYPGLALQRSEIALTSEKYGFNGTIDCIGQNGSLILVDWKTGQAKEKDAPEIYDEYKYQVSAYVHLYNEIQGTGIDRALIVSIAKDKVAYATYGLEAQEIKDSFNNVFLSCLNILNHQKKMKARKKDAVLNEHEG